MKQEISWSPATGQERGFIRDVAIAPAFPVHYSGVSTATTGHDEAFQNSPKTRYLVVRVSVRDLLRLSEPRSLD
jgi:hypothetical protein